MNADLQLRFRAVSDRIEIMRLHWLSVCQFKCQPSVEEDLEILERAVKILHELVEQAIQRD